MDNLKQLEKLSKLFNFEKIMTTDDVEAVLKSLITVLANNKKEVGDTAEKIRSEAELIFGKVIDAQEKSDKDINDSVNASLEKSKKVTESRLKDTLKKCSELLDEARSVMPKDGKDADEEAIVEKVLNKIPEQKKIILDTPEELKKKLESLTEDNRLDASAIKNLPEVKGTGGIGGVRNIQVLDESTVITKALRKIKFTGSGVQASIVDGIVVVTISGGSSNESIAELLTNSGDDLSFTFANTPTSVSVIWDEGTGQVYTPGVSKDYTYTGTTLTFNSAQTGRNIRANYVY